jgi:TRAP transporter TAXI family solute receptor
MVLSGGQPSGVYAGMADAIAQLVNAEHTDIRIKVEPSQGSEENRDRLEDGAVDLALIQNDAKAGPEIRTLAPLYVEVLHFMARRDSPIRHLQHIRGRRVAVGKEGSGSERLFAALVKHHGFGYEDFEPQHMQTDEAISALIAGQVEAVAFVAGLKSAAGQRSIESGKVRLIPLGRVHASGGEVDGFRLDYPFVKSAVIPIQTYGSTRLADGGEPQHPLITVGVSSILACRADADPSVVKAITRSIFQNRAKLIHEFPIAAGVTEEFDRTALQFSLHPGAERYYRRSDPGYLARNAEPMAFILSLAIAIVAAGSGVKSWIQRRKKNRIDGFFLRLLKIVEQLHDERLESSQVIRLRDDLNQMHREAFEQLVNEDLNADESFRIFQTMILEYQGQVEKRVAQLRPQSSQVTR